MTQNIKYLKFGLRADNNLSDLTNPNEAITNLVDDLSLQSVEIDPSVKSFDANDTNVISAIDDTITINGHGFLTGDEVVYSCTGGVDSSPTPLAPLVSGTSYFVVRSSNNLIKLASSALLANSVPPVVLNFETSAINAAEDGASFHKLFKKSTQDTLFDFNDLDPLNGLALTALPERVGTTTQAPGAPAEQSIELREIGNITEKFTRASDNVLLNVAPRVTVMDKLENFKSITGDPPSKNGGDGPKAFIVPAERINTSLSTSTTGTSSASPVASLGTNLFTTSIDSTLSNIVGPVKFWDAGTWSLPGSFPGTSFKDDFGLIQWTGYLDNFHIQTVVSNGFYIIEQDTVSITGNETEENWTTLASVLSESITINASWATNAQGVTVVTPTDATVIKHLGENMRVVGSNLNGRDIASFNYITNTNIPESFNMTESSDGVAVSSGATDISIQWVLGTRTRLRSPIAQFDVPSRRKKPRVRYTVLWPKINNRTLEEKIFQVKRGTQLDNLSYTTLYSDFTFKSQGIYSFDFFNANRVSSRQELSKTPVTVKSSSTSLYIPPKTNAEIYSTGTSGIGSKNGPARRFKALNEDGKIQSITGRFPKDSTLAGKFISNINLSFLENESFLGSSLVIRTKNKLFQYRILETPYVVGGTINNQAVIDRNFISQINSSDSGEACPTTANGGTGKSIIPNDSDFFVGMLWRHLGLVGIYELKFESTSVGKLYAIENGEPVTSIASGDLLFQQEIAWTNGDEVNSKMNQTNISDAISSPLVATKVTLSSETDGTLPDGAFATVETRQIHNSSATFLDTANVSNGLGALSKVIVGVYASSGVRDLTRHDVTGDNKSCRGVYGKLTVADAGTSQNKIELDSIAGLTAGDANTGDFVQFSGSIPLGTHIASFDGNKIVLSTNITGVAIPAGRTVVIIPRGVPDSVYKASAPASREECVLPLDSSAPFLSTPTGLATTSTNSNLKVKQLKIDDLSLRLPSANILPAGSAIFESFVNLSGDKFNSDDTISIPNHSFVNGDIVRFSKVATSFNINNLTDGSVYYVINAVSGASGTIKLSESPGGTARDISPTLASANFRLTRATESKLVIESANINFSPTNVSANQITLTGHEFKTNDKVKYVGLATDIGGLTSGQFYYVKVIDADTIELYAEEALTTIKTLSGGGDSNSKNHSLGIVFKGYVLP